MKKWLPGIIVLLFAGWLAGSLRMPPDKGFAYTQFGQLPLVFDGRTQPFDSLARNTLLQLRKKQTANLEPWKSWYQSPKIIPATQWLLGVMMTPDVADTWPVFRIDNPDLKGLLGLADEPDLAKQQDGEHFSWQQIKPHLEDLRRETARAGQVADSSKTPYDRALVHLWTAQLLYHRLENALGPSGNGQFAADLVPYLKKAEAGYDANDAVKANRDYDTNALDWLAEQFQTPLIVPPAAPTGGQWLHAVEASMQPGSVAGAPDFALLAFNDMARAYRANDADAFNQAIAGYRSKLAEHGFNKALLKGHNEQYFNFLDPFYKAMVIDVCAFLFVLAYWFRPGQWDWLRRTAVGLVGLALVVHTAGLLFRMFLEGRPPVTNLYSSAIFIGWGATILGLVLERFWRNSIGVMVSSIIGFLTLIIAHHLRLGGDTMEMMQAVLDTNFWLATHVVVVTLGYASTFVAGVLGIIYVVLGVFTPRLSERWTPDQATGAGVAAGYLAGGVVGAAVAGAVACKSAELGDTFGKSLNRMIYGIICFATLFSFVGTVLGGIWADQSWGRFWGWDPKENGALIIVLWNALVLHARWGGLVRERGLATMAIVGNIVTSWSWFGVNMLGIGLHSYGFTAAAFRWLSFFIASQVFLILLGLLPRRMWRSFQTAASPSGPQPTGNDGKPAAGLT
jgi:cytochrome c-type biogenesis protein CcsB